MLALRTEKDELRVLDRAHAVPRRPVKKVAFFASLDFTVDVRHLEFSREHVAPMRSMAGVVLETFQERRNVSTCPQGEILATHLAETSRVTEVCGDTCDGTGDVDLGRNLIFGDTHDRGLRSYWRAQNKSKVATQQPK
jgi:hypothetical protein